MEDSSEIVPYTYPKPTAESLRAAPHATRPAAGSAAGTEFGSATRATNAFEIRMRHEGADEGMKV